MQYAALVLPNDSTTHFGGRKMADTLKEVAGRSPKKSTWVSFQFM